MKTQRTFEVHVKTASVHLRTPRKSCYLFHSGHKGNQIGFCERGRGGYCAHPQCLTPTAGS